MALKEEAINFTKLPYDILRIIVEYVDPRSIPALRATSRCFRGLLFDETVRGALFRQHFPFAAIVPSTDASKPDYFDKAIKQLRNRQEGRPTCALLVHNADANRVAREAEASYDHHFLAYYSRPIHEDGIPRNSELTILDIAGRHPSHPQVIIELLPVCPVLRALDFAFARSENRTVTLDHRSVVVSGIPIRMHKCVCGVHFPSAQSENGNNDDTAPYRRPMVVYDITNYPDVKLRALWHQQTVTRSSLWNVCARSDWIAYTERGYSPVWIVHIPQLETACGENDVIKAEISIWINDFDRYRIYVKDLHMTRTHLFIYTSDDTAELVRIDVFAFSIVDGAIKVKKTRSVLLEDWYGCCSTLIGVAGEGSTHPVGNPDNWQDCWSKFSPAYTGRLDELGAPEERDDMVEFTLGRSVYGNAYIPLATVYVNTQSERGNAKDTILPNALITTNLAYRFADPDAIEDYSSCIEDLPAPSFEEFHNFSKRSYQPLASCIPYKGNLTTVLYDHPPSDRQWLSMQQRPTQTADDNHEETFAQLVPRWKITTSLGDIPSIPIIEIPAPQEPGKAFVRDACLQEAGFEFSGYVWQSDFLKGLIIKKREVERLEEEHDIREFGGVKEVKLLFLRYD